jgi:hypothetical protein
VYVLNEFIKDNKIVMSVYVCNVVLNRYLVVVYVRTKGDSGVFVLLVIGSFSLIFDGRR